MANIKAFTSEVLDETTLSLEELALACTVEPQWVLDRIEAGILNGVLSQSTTWCFVSADLARAQRLISIERDFEADPELAALVVDLIEEVKRLRSRLKSSGLPAS